ncbi:ribonuclease Z [Oenococcus sicerae]|uniref:Ribonuclease Z n=1 Tax=Oenococcus sicerae TaxID=2203724 RepID=A0AAJ1R948_9LACO|nr:ribonuclease Z [Oenococcus sicerae]MDN6899800.1 ribonuclease Z [Oenococcus sicerae]
MELEFLGTGAGQPSKQRNVTSIALRLLDERNEVWLFDVGEATQHQLLKSNTRSRKVTKIFITHMHGDHIFGLPGFLTSRNFQGSEIIDGGRPTDLTIYGPAALQQFVFSVLRAAQVRLQYRVNFVQVHTGVIFNDKQFSVSAFAMNHGIEDYAYRVVEKDTVGELEVQKLLDLGLQSGPVFGKIKAGQTIKLSDGRVINGQEFVGPDRPGRIVAIVLDTKETPAIIDAAKNADVLVHEATYDGDNSVMAKKHGHSTSVQAAEHAKKAGAKGLILTHISARYLGHMADQLVKQAKSVFPNTEIAHDLEVFDIPAKKSERKDQVNAG